MIPVSRSFLLSTALVALWFPLPGLGQSAVPAVPKIPNDPSEILRAATPLYDFSAPDLKPWHLKATYQLYDLKGKPADQGVWEYWWVSPKVHRSSWTRPGAEHTEWSTTDGASYRKDSGTPLRYFERTIQETLLFPLPGRGVLESGRLKLDLKMLPPDKPELACVVTNLQWLIDGKLQSPSSGMASYYCFDPATLALRMTYSNELTKQFSQLVKTQGRYLARQVAVTEGKQKLFTTTVDAIEAFTPSDSIMAPSADSSLRQQPASPPGSSQADVTTGSLVKKTQPVYPLISKMAHEQGVVVLGAVIGTDGKIHDLEVLASPSPVLAESAVDSVKKWEYKPYLLNGVPVEVETVVNVTYSLGR